MKRGITKNKPQEWQGMHNTIAQHLLSDAQALTQPTDPGHLPRFVSWAWRPLGWRIPLAGVGQLSWPCSPLLVSAMDKVKILSPYY